MLFIQHRVKQSIFNRVSIHLVLINNIVHGCIRVLFQYYARNIYMLLKNCTLYSRSCTSQQNDFGKRNITSNAERLPKLNSPSRKDPKCSALLPVRAEPDIFIWGGHWRGQFCNKGSSQ